MVTPSHDVGNHLGKSTTIYCLFIQFSCAVAFSPKEHGSDESSSQRSQSGTLINTPKKIMKKISKAIVPYICMKTKPLEESSPPATNPKKVTKLKIGKVMVPYMCLKIRQHEDEECLWKKTILMGEKCQPLEFSGAIFYDSEGNQVSEPPRSPRSSDLGSPYPKFVETEMQFKY